MAAAAAAANPRGIAPATGVANASSTLGADLNAARLIAELKASLLLSPREFNGKPCTVLGFVGFKGAAKSTYINALRSVLGGSAEFPQRANFGPEAGASTVEDELVPLHPLLFPDAASDPPAYFFVWDTVGFPYHEPQRPGTPVLYTAQAVSAVMRELLRGGMPTAGGNMQAGGNGAGVAMPLMPAQAIFVLGSASQLVTVLSSAANRDVNVANRQISLLRETQALCATWRHGVNPNVPLPPAAIGVPVYAIVTALDRVLPDVERAGGAADWDSVAFDPRLVDVAERIVVMSGVPFGRVSAAFGLNTLRAGSGTDVRELAVLVPVVAAVREAVSRDVAMRAQQLAIRARDNAAQVVGLPGQAATPALPYMDVVQLQAFLAARPRMAAAAPIAGREGISGFELVRMTDAEIAEVFGGAGTFGLRKALSCLVAPYRDAAAAADRAAQSDRAEQRLLTVAATKPPPPPPPAPPLNWTAELPALELGLTAPVFSTIHNPSHAPIFRLNQPAFGGMAGAWCPLTAECANDWIHFAFERPVRVTRVAIQGRAEHPTWVTRLKLLTSDLQANPVQWDPVTGPNGEDHVGNTDQTTIVYIPVNRVARAVRLVPTAANGHCAMRFEVYVQLHCA
jgi:hypothetical protein